MHNKKCTFVVFAVLCLACVMARPLLFAAEVGGAGTKDPRNFAVMLPESTLMYLHIPSVRTIEKHFDKSAAGAICNQPGVKKFLAPLFEMLQRVKKMTPQPDGTVFPLGIETVAGLVDGSLAIAVLGVTPLGPNDFIPNVVVASRLKDKTKGPDDIINVITKSLPERLRKTAARSEYMLGKQNIKILKIGKISIFFAVYDDIIAASTSLTGFSQIQRTRAGKEDAASLATSALYKSVRKHVGRGADAAFLFVNNEVLAEFVRQGAGDPAALRILGRFGFFAVQGIGIGTRFEGKGLKDTIYIHAPGPRIGVLKLLSLPPVDDRVFATIPAGCDFAFSANLPPDTIFAEAKKIVAAFGPDGKVFMAALGNVDKILDMPLEDALATFNGAVTVYSKNGATYCRLGIRRRGNVNKLIARLNAVGRDLGMSFETTAYRGRTIYHLVSKKYLVPFPLSFFADNGTLVVGASPQSVKSYLLNAQKEEGRIEPSLADTRDFKKVAQKIEGSRTFFLYADLKKNFKASYNLFMPFLAMLKSLPGAPIQLEALPPAADLQPHLFGLGFAVSSTKEGITITCFSPFGSAGLPLALVSNPQLVASLLFAAGAPASTISAARLRERQHAQAAKRLKEVYTAIKLHHMHAEQYPRALDALVPKYLKDAALLRSPRTGEPFDYLPEAMAGKDPKAVVCYETGNTPDGTVLFIRQNGETGTLPLRHFNTLLDMQLKPRDKPAPEREAPPDVF